MATVTHDTEVEVDPKVPLIRITRAFDAPPSAVFRAHTDINIFVRWHGPVGTEIDVERFDCRPGGSYRYVHTYEGQEYGFHGCFHEVRASDLIVQTYSFDALPDCVALERIELDDLGDGRARLVSTAVVRSIEDRDAFVARGLEQGTRASYVRLDEVLAAG